MSDMMEIFTNVIIAPIQFLATYYGNFVEGLGYVPEPKPISMEDLKSSAKRLDYSEALFQYYNYTVFGNKLPKNWVIVNWNPHLRTTAGRCFQGSVGDKKIAMIQLSPKICDTWERTRDTLVHEMCHAATWMVDDIKHTDHNQTFAKWGTRVTATHPEIPPVQAFHNYTIYKPFAYRCLKCGYREGRHTNSLDATPCRHCGGRFKRVKAPSRSDLKTMRARGAGSERRPRDDVGVARLVTQHLRRTRQYAHLSQGAVLHMLTRGPDKGKWAE